jgi:hypothetical protein
MARKPRTKVFVKVHGDRIIEVATGPDMILDESYIRIEHDDLAHRIQGMDSENYRIKPGRHSKSKHSIEKRNQPKKGKE